MKCFIQAGDDSCLLVLDKCVSCRYVCRIAMLYCDTYTMSIEVEVEVEVVTIVEVEVEVVTIVEV